MKAWITKYALSKGIIEVDGRIDPSNVNSFIVPPSAGSLFPMTSYFYGIDWHTSQYDAVIRADDMRKAKIKALTKQLEKLKALRFEVEG
jgi:hypothetical protein